jgi:hypothetical protein
MQRLTEIGPQISPQAGTGGFFREDATFFSLDICGTNGFHLLVKKTCHVPLAGVAFHCAILLAMIRNH